MNKNLTGHGLVREVFVSHMAKNAIPFLMGEATTPDFTGLRSVNEVAELALARWIIPRGGKTWQVSRLEFLVVPADFQWQQHYNH